MKKSLYVLQWCGRCKMTSRRKWLTPLEALNYAVRNVIEPYMCGLCKDEIRARYQAVIDRRVAAIMRANEAMRSYLNGT